MVIVVEGDLFSCSEDVIGHQCNCIGLWGATGGKGNVAYQMRKKFPTVHAEYKKLCKATKPEELLGQCQIVNENGKWIANLFGQNTVNWWSRSLKTEYDKLEQSLMGLKQFAKEKRLSIALPYKIGCARGGGDWEVVSTILERVFSDYDVTLYKL